jgi:uncharacterized protein (TIGR02145 family)
MRMMKNKSMLFTIKLYLTLVIIVGLSINSNAQNDKVTYYNDTLTDIDGNIYRTITIGSKTWMAENLRVTHFPDSTPIKNVDNRLIDGAKGNKLGWNALNDGNSHLDAAFCWYNNDSSSNAQSYGALYTWAAAMGIKNEYDSIINQIYIVQGVCPDGWHLPSDQEWMELEHNLGLSPKDTSTNYWRGLSLGSSLANQKDLWKEGELIKDTAFSKSGFSAIPSGYRHSGGDFYGLHERSIWWSSTIKSETWAWGRDILYKRSDIRRANYSKSNGHSIRCIKD